MSFSDSLEVLVTIMLSSEGGTSKVTYIV